ncbi:helix-turn-helix domain-containing protein [Poseidonocella sp. HB161398]|uniref:helix-turn-helix domain-containing protein n=1 Tax=Poseidonocella sp. HB161398 TaxID=2320855 RepID=UPI00110841EA|nr:helix-turn-helix transcriptional regulator [Poseidonocella sp. HB161398]
MENTESDLIRPLADHLRALRTGQGLTLQDLAGRSGISRATLSRIENGEVSPTAETLGRLATALALPISQLLAPLEPGFEPLMRRAGQSVWEDPGKQFTRRNVSPPSRQLTVELLECTIGPHQRISYGAPARPGQEHHLLLLEGRLRLTVDGAAHELGPGDCLRYCLRGASSFETAEAPVRYIIALA